jgi:hypothetical protein
VKYEGCAFLDEIQWEERMILDWVPGGEKKTASE